MRFTVSRPKLKSVKHKKILSAILLMSSFFKKEFVAYANFLQIYTRGKLFYFSEKFESNKSIIVRNVLIKRGKRNRFFLHISAMAILTLGVLVSPFIQDPFSENNENAVNVLAFTEERSLTPEEVFETQESVKPRSEIVTYTAQKGDTLSGGAEKFNG